MSSGVIDYAAILRQGLPDVDFFDHRNHVATLPGTELVHKVTRRAGVLAARGLARGDRIVLVANNTEPYLITVLACLLLGAVSCAVAPPPAPSRPDSAGVQHLESAIAVVDPVVVVAQAEVAVAVRHPGLVTFGELEDGQPIPFPATPASPNDVHHIQLTSGSTSAPKAVVLTHANVAHNIAVLAEAMGATRGRDRIFSWLPMYHDMGFIQVLGALVNGLPIGLMAPLAFLRDPLSWLRHMSRHGSTVSAGPPFAYRAATDALGRAPRPPDLDLSALRYAYVGAEPIPFATLREFTDSFAPFGLRADALVPYYGMAETVLATTLALRTAAAGPLNFGRVRVRDSDEGAPLVGCGRPVEGLTVRIVDADGNTVPDGVIGDIVVGGRSVMLGYQLPDGTVGAPPGGWHDTGDRGLRCDGELFVVGRSKEMVIVRGRNFPPQDIERVIETVPGTAAGSCVVFSAPDDHGAESVIAVVGTQPGMAEPEDISNGIATAVRRVFGFSLDDIVLVRRGVIPRTSSGKLQRLKARELYLRGCL